MHGNICPILLFDLYPFILTSTFTPTLQSILSEYSEYFWIFWIWISKQQTFPKNVKSRKRSSKTLPCKAPRFDNFSILKSFCKIICNSPKDITYLSTNFAFLITFTNHEGRACSILPPFVSLFRLRKLWEHNVWNVRNFRVKNIRRCNFIIIAFVVIFTMKLLFTMKFAWVCKGLVGFGLAFYFKCFWIYRWYSW